MTVVERPILFSAPMVRAILEGRKTQTRRLVKPPMLWDGCLSGDCPHGRQVECDQHLAESCPYGHLWDRLWVREGFAMPDRITNGGRPSLPVPDHDVGQVHYLADGPAPAGWRARPSIHLPRWASRIDLEVLAVRVEQLRSITDADARAEGVRAVAGGRATDADAFLNLWDLINGDRGPAASNPWVWVVTFRRIRP